MYSCVFEGGKCKHRIKIGQEIQGGEYKGVVGRINDEEYNVAVSFYWMV